MIGIPPRSYLCVLADRGRMTPTSLSVQSCRLRLLGLSGRGAAPSRANGPVPTRKGSHEMDTQSRKDGRIELTENALAVLEKRYLKKDEKGEPTEEPMDMFRRVAATSAGAEARFAADGRDPANLVEFWQAKFLELMTSRRFLPNSPTLIPAPEHVFQQAGKPLQHQLGPLVAGPGNSSHPRTSTIRRHMPRFFQSLHLL